MKRPWSLCFVAGLAVALAVGVTAASAAPKKVDVGVKHAPEAVEKGTLPLASLTPSKTTSGFQTLGRTAAKAAAAEVGEQKTFLALDDRAGQYFFDDFTLKAIGDHIEIWVQDDLDFPSGDCRNDNVRNVVTQPQLDSFVHEFDTNIYPKESDAFSVPPDRDGTDATLPGLVGLPADYYVGDGDKIVTLIENVRDDNYYTPPNVEALSYIAGFFSTQLNGYFGRNTMTIDAYDWLHRTGANPPNEPDPNDICNSKPARPHLYEGTFAHEYQHLLESYEDPDEVNWINEGLSDWAQSLVGYVKPSTPIQQIGYDSHIQCFLGWLSVQTPANPNPSKGGPENSLTRWGDQGDGEILCDYGAAYTMMEFLAGRYGVKFMSALHDDDGNGFVGLQDVLNDTGHDKVEASDVLHDWSLMVALDGLIDDGAKIKGNPKEKKVTAPTLDATINWDNPDAYDTPGAPSNGADYVRLRDSGGQYLSGGQIAQLSFQGESTLPTRPVMWSVDAAPPLGGASATSGPALYSGAADDRDEAIVRPITVGTGANATLSFDALWNEEEGWDFGFVQVSTDGGGSYDSVACTDTTTEINPDALPTAQDNIPGFTGYSGAWKPEKCDLSAYAGQNVLLAFRTFNDPASLGTVATIPPGFWIDNVELGTTSLSDGSNLTGWKSFSETKPSTVAGYTVYIVSLNTAKYRDGITVKSLKLTSDFSIKGKAKVQKYIDKNADFVGAIVMYDDPSETANDYARYSLVVNGATQPGGS
ncbi:MAG TPA: hypothetical protein VGF10_06105 [Gaiella sp.]|jgi:hypothetical protein